MSALCKRLACIRPVLKGKTGIHEWTQVEQIKWSLPMCRLCTNASNGKEMERGFTQPDPEFATKPQQRLTKFQKMLLFHSGKYPSMETCPNFVGDKEMGYAMDMCKILFNTWVMMVLCFFWFFINCFHFRDKEMGYAMDMCKTLFNTWVMMVLCFFWFFIHQIEMRRMRREHARINRKQQRMMKKWDKINREDQELRKIIKLKKQQAVKA